MISTESCQCVEKRRRTVDAIIFFFGNARRIKYAGLHIWKREKNEGFPSRKRRTSQENRTLLTVARKVEIPKKRKVNRRWNDLVSTNFKRKQLELISSRIRRNHGREPQRAKNCERTGCFTWLQHFQWPSWHAVITMDKIWRILTNR